MYKHIYFTSQERENKLLEIAELVENLQGNRTLDEFESLVAVVKAAEGCHPSTEPRCAELVRAAVEVLLQQANGFIVYGSGSELFQSALECVVAVRRVCVELLRDGSLVNAFLTDTAHAPLHVLLHEKSLTLVAVDELEGGVLCDCLR